jgi:hypothetical protein
MRGGPVEQQLLVADPARSAQAAARLIGRHDRTVKIYRGGGTSTVDFEIDPAAGAGLEQELKRDFPQAAVRPGFNRWVFRQRP